MSHEHKTNVDIKSRDVATSTPSVVAGNKSSTQLCKPYEKNVAQDKKNNISNCIFIQLAHSHANMYVNNNFWLVPDRSIFEASVPAAVFAR